MARELKPGESLDPQNDRKKIRKIYQGGRFFVINTEGTTDVTPYVGQLSCYDDRFEYEGFRP